MPEPDRSPPAAIPLVGRERESATLREALAAALAGRGGLVLIGGEAGIGKTTLAEWLCGEGSANGALVLVGRCYDLAETPPYGPWAEALARAPRDPALPAPPALAAGAASEGPGAFFGLVRDFLAALAARRPVVLLLDDLHWADPVSLDLLRALARGLAECPILLLATYRTDELTRRHSLYQLLPALVREARAVRLDLYPLAEIGLRALVTAHYALPIADEDRLVSYLTERAEGNPFYAGELLRSLAEAGALHRGGDGWTLGDLAGMRVPLLLRQVIDARIDRLGEATRELLAVAAIIGQEIPLATWAAVAGVAEEALVATAETATGAGLLALTDDGAGARFAHALIREALYEGTLATRRRGLHRRTADVLLGVPNADPDAVAYHLQRAGDPRAAGWLERAGVRAQEANAWVTAAARYEAALALLGDDGSTANARGWLHARLVRVRRFNDRRRAIAHGDAALALGEATGDRALAAFARYHRGMARWDLPDLTAGVAALEALGDTEFARLDPVGGDDFRAARGSWLLMAAQTGQFDVVLAWAERWREQRPPPATTLGNGLPYAQGWSALGIALAMRGEPERALEAFAQALSYQGGISTVFGGRTVLMLVTLPYRAERLDERRQVAARAAAAAARAVEIGGLRPGWADAPLRLVEGRWGDDLRRALEHLPTAIIVRFGLLAQLHRLQGRAGDAWAQVRLACPAGPATEPGGIIFHDWLLVLREAALLALDARDLPVAREWLAAHDRWIAWCGAVLGRAEGALGWAAYHRVAGDRAGARQHAEAALAHATEPRQPLALLAACRALGELATDARMHAEAQGHLDAALALADACAAPYERALTLLALAELRASEGQAEATAQTLAAARAILEPLAAAPALARAATLAARLVAAPPAAPLPFGLTTREVEVLRLVAAGLTDAQAAERLFLSPRTVGQHLRSVYNKLGVENRLAAARLALERGLA